MKNRTITTMLVAATTLLALADAASAYYSPRLGRFLSRDPISEPGAVLVHQAARPAMSFLPRDPIEGRQDKDLYRYVDNSPTNYVDPHGLCPLAQPGEVKWGTIVLQPGGRYFNTVNAWLEAGIVVNGMVNARFFKNACCPAIGVVQIARENYDNGGFGGWVLDKGGSSTPPFYAHSSPLPPARIVSFGFTDNPGWNPPGSYSNNTFAHEFTTCVVCANNSSGKWKVGCSLGCINWGYNYSKNSAPPPDHIVNLWVRGCSLVSGPPVQNPLGPTLTCSTPYTTRSDSNVETLIAPYR